MKLLKIKMKSITANINQPRKYFDAEKMEELKESIKNNGLIQPITVRRIEAGKNKGKYEIIAGERRFRAFRMLGMEEIDAIRLEAGDLKSYEYSVLENIQRENLNAVEEAESYAMLIEVYGYSQEKLAEKFGKSRSAVANKIRILKLPEKVKDMVRKNELSYGHARTLLSLNDPGEILKVAEKTGGKNISVRNLEKIVRKLNGKKANGGEEKEETEKQRHLSEAVNIKENNGEKSFIEEKLKEFFETKVKINGDIHKSGKIEIDFYNYEDLSRIIELLEIDFE